MTKNEPVLAIFDTHDEAEAAIKKLQMSGFNMKQLSIIGRDYHTEEGVVGYYNTTDRMKYWGKFGAFWGGIFGALVGAGFFWVPGIGQILVAGPLLNAIVGALEGAALVGGFDAVGAGFYSLGIPEDSVLQYHKSLKASKFLVVAHGNKAEVNHAKEILFSKNEALT